MTVTTVAFFNNKGGVGKTSLVYHLSWMYAELGVSVVAADLDPQANLTAAFIEEDKLELIWSEVKESDTVYETIRPLLEGTHDIAEPKIASISEHLGLLVGDLSLSQFEDELAMQWPLCLSEKPRAFRVTSAFWRVMQKAASQYNADMILIDLGPNLGAINRSALLAADYVVVPLTPDLFSLQGLRNLGPILRKWRSDWRDRLDRNPIPDLALPKGMIEPIGYIVQQHSERLDRPVKAYAKWIKRIPSTYAEVVLDSSLNFDVDVNNDPNCLALIKHYRSLMAMAQEARKPMFHLKPADGAIGGHIQTVQGAYRDFRTLAKKIAERIRIEFVEN